MPIHRAAPSTINFADIALASGDEPSVRDPLLTYPLKMALEIFIRLKQLLCRKLLAQSHFIITLVNATMTLPTDINTRIELLFVVVFTKMRTAMQLTRDKMMKSKRAIALAE